jgi:hypothetical protein
MLQPGRLARHTRRESDAVMTRIAAQETQSDMVSMFTQSLKRKPNTPV